MTYIVIPVNASTKGIQQPLSGEEMETIYNWKRFEEHMIGKYGDGRINRKVGNQDKAHVNNVLNRISSKVVHPQAAIWLQKIKDFELATGANLASKKKDYALNH